MIWNDNGDSYTSSSYYSKLKNKKREKNEEENVYCVFKGYTVVGITVAYFFPSVFPHSFRKFSILYLSKKKEQKHVKNIITLLM